MVRLVQKFGGTSVKDIDHIRRVAKIIVRAAEEGNQVATVVSAMGHTTDHLISLAEQVNADASPREMDMLLATGEQVSIALLSMAVQALGAKARSFTGAQAGIITDSTHGAARIKEIATGPLEECLGRGEIAIVAGFQGIAPVGEITTLGRGGSDTTAVALAAALKSGTCDIYTDVNGVYTADPRYLPGARRLPALSYEEMLELSTSGAQVLNSRSVELAMNTQVAIRLRSTFEPDDVGTLITHRFDAPEYTICGIACDTSQTSFRLKLSASDLRGCESEPAIKDLQGVTELFQRFNESGIAFNSVTLLGKSQGSVAELVFTTEKRQAHKAEAVIARLRQALGEPEVIVDADIARISVVGCGLNSQKEVVTAITDTLCSKSIPIQMLTAGDIRVTALVPDRFKREAVEHIHERFLACPPVDTRVFR